MTMVVRDEADILPANLEYHLAQGIDVILVTDHGSIDSTPEILAEYRRTGPVYFNRDEAPAHDQVSRVDRLLRIAERGHGAEWVIHCDADEFWLPAVGSLRDVFAAVPDHFGYLVVERNNFPPLAEDGRPFHQRMTFRERRTLNIRGEELEPKVAQRPGAGSGVTAGNHDLKDPQMERAPDIGAVAVGHFPMRTYEQFERKVINAGTGYELLEDRDEGVGADQFKLLRMQRSGGLPDYFEAMVLDEQRIQERLEAGELVGDDRVRELLSSDGEQLDESGPIQELLRRAWLAAAAADDARLAAEHRAHELDAGVARLQLEVEQARQSAAELTERMALIRASRTMRYTASARRAYYRLRPHGDRGS
jgi:hypothetical protein